ncbi:hypothetical protein AVEN_255350-1 [Araneus ventricosus]|uniref:DDE-1 domain-containing protein n=1 Tax=Araneus ventricosus TaxID=182803 RepID=A0A4Y2WD37_ARAVE|nr:hypothetical protein AVEN_255350-1 [Araneus ventricosus]
MGQGVIRSLKCHYRKQLILRILECYDKNKDCDISLLDAAVLLEKTWRLVTESTIRNCLTGLFWYPRLSWETSLFPHVNNGKSDVSLPNRGYQNRHISHVGLKKTQQTEDDEIPLSKWLEKHGVNAFSQNEIEHFECCDDDVITSGEGSEEDIVALVNEKKL